MQPFADQFISIKKPTAAFMTRAPKEVVSTKDTALFYLGIMNSESFGLFL